MREVTIFRDIVTEKYPLNGNYFEEVSFNSDERGTIWTYPVETYVWCEEIPNQYNEDGSKKVIKHTFEYVATKKFKEGFEIFFNQIKHLETKLTLEEYYSSHKDRQLSKAYNDLSETREELNTMKNTGFWKRLNFLFGGEV